MKAARRQLRLASHLALVAMFALVLLPTVSHALSRLAAAGSRGFAEVCTPQGMKLLGLADAESRPASAALHLEHCAYCSTSGAAAPPPAALAAGLASTEGTAPPALSRSVPAPHTAWPTAQPRAPPAGP